MALTETILPRPILFNGALYACLALIYTVVIFSLEAARPGEYVFSDSDESKWRTVFNNTAIVSWPVLLFGALILIAVRAGANVRRRRRKRSKRKKSKKKSNSHRSTSTLSNRNNSDNTIPNQPLPPSTTPPPVALRAESAHRHESAPDLVHTLTLNDDEENPDLLRVKSSRRVKRSRSETSHVPRGYVSVTRAQRLYAAFGFLWVAVGLAVTAAAAAIVFVGQREHFDDVARILGSENPVWKTWVIPLLTSGILIPVFGVLAITTSFKFFSTLTARYTVAMPTPAASEGSVREVEDIDLLYKMDNEIGEDDVDDDFVAADSPSANLGEYTRIIDSAILPTVPDQSTVDRLMRQLRDMGFRNPDQNMAALQASSFDLEKASEKLANTAT
ncbi:hypothetical protein BWQ96_04299 [Gracilariopsis chorda]|uniref:UBA domain-containing protein n=1 Tax=Gracilariopsis chorda TaxID=448386 RepID=A0A2V3IUW8_9FLOR|nr:hypothetical protein BWQ96_04299 [Gracilariopsis chorda]|eukprot:PXF45938.1 hypothetical protein BWQ96_04299 [Gracilariopsis chorda]